LKELHRDRQPQRNWWQHLKIWGRNFVRAAGKNRLQAANLLIEKSSIHNKCPQASQLKPVD